MVFIFIPCICTFDFSSLITWLFYMTSPVIIMALVVFISTVDIFDLIQNFDNKNTGTKEHVVFVYIRSTMLGVTTPRPSVCPTDRPFLLPISTLSKGEKRHSLGDVKRSIWPDDHYLRKYLSLKSFSNYHEFYLTNCFNDLLADMASKWIHKLYQHFG